MKTLQEIKSEFKLFINSIPTNLELLKNRLQIEQLQYSVEEIDQVENWYRQNHRKPANKELTLAEIDTLIQVYIGTAFLWHFGGRWEVETSKSGYYGKFQIIEYGGEGYGWVAFVPSNLSHLIRTGQMDDKIADYFRDRVDYFERHKEFKLNQIRNHQ